MREQRWGPRTLDVDVICAHGRGGEIVTHEDELTLPHPMAHLRAFVLVPWLDVDPDATLTVAGEAQPVHRLLAAVDPAERAAVTVTDSVLRSDRAGT